MKIVFINELSKIRPILASKNRMNLLWMLGHKGERKATKKLMALPQKVQINHKMRMPPHDSCLPSRCNSYEETLENNMIDTY